MYVKELQQVIEKTKEVKNIADGPSVVKSTMMPASKPAKKRLISPTSIKPGGSMRPTGHFGGS